jgi:hypothetical protein
MPVCACFFEADVRLSDRCQAGVAINLVGCQRVECNKETHRAGSPVQPAEA